MTPSWWTWSLPLGRWFATDVRLHWSLMVIAVLHAVEAVLGGVPFWWIGVLLLVPFFSILLHEFGHVTAARLCGGQADRIVMWAMGGLAMCSAPMRPAPQFFVAAAGPLVNLVIAGLIVLTFPASLSGTGAAYASHGLLGATLAYIVAWEIANLLFNLIPCYPMDGGRMLRAGLWPVVGYRTAQRWTIVVAWVVLVAAGVWALLTSQAWLVLLVVVGVMAVLQEQRMIREGLDPYFQDQVVRDTPPLLVRWRASRAAAAEQRTARIRAEEDAVLDRLLAKVSAEGLPSLTPAERRQLHAISDRRRQESP